jgi:nucleoid-associated protein YgaU
VVQKGDTLWEIAQKFYDDPRAWEKVLEANSHLIKKAKDIRPQMRLVLP